MSQKAADSVLTPEEREWAFALEEALYGTNDDATAPKNSENGRARRTFRRNRQVAGDSIKYKDMPTDFELATHAMIGKGNTARALKRIKRLSAFKETYRVPDFEADNEYDTDNAIEAVLLAVKKFLMAYPDFIKSVGMDKHGRVAVVVRLRGLRWSHPPPFNHTESDRMRGLYCILNALQPTVESVRRGTVWIADLGGVTEKPAATFLEGCRKLLRDSYPIRVQDIPAIRCPPVYSGAFVGTRPFWSRHFGQRFVRVDSETLRQHFPASLLYTKKNKNGKNQQQPGATSMPNHRKKALRNKHKTGSSNQHGKEKVVVVASNGDQYDNKWENLEDSDDEDPNGDKRDDLLSDSQSDWSDWMSNGAGSQNGAEEVIGKNNIDDELYTKLERLVRMRFETEQTFKVA